MGRRKWKHYQDVLTRQPLNLLDPSTNATVADEVDVELLQSAAAAVVASSVASNAVPPSLVAAAAAVGGNFVDQKSGGAAATAAIGKFLKRDRVFWLDLCGFSITGYLVKFLVELLIDLMEKFLVDFLRNSW